MGGKVKDQLVGTRLDAYRPSPGVLQAMRMSRLILHSLRYPIVQAPMAGGPSTPALAAEVSRAGGLGFLAAGYKTVDQVERELAEVRSLVPAGVPYGINLFAPPGHGVGAVEVNVYADRLRNEAQAQGVDLGHPRPDLRAAGPGRIADLRLPDTVPGGPAPVVRLGRLGHRHHGW